MKHTILLVVAVLFSTSLAFGESTAEMFSSCNLLNDAQIRGDTVALPIDFDSGMCWGAFSVYRD